MPLQLNNRYRALYPIGQGGFGRTFLAVDEHRPSRPRCVVKQFCPQDLMADQVEKAARLFHEEAIRLDQLGQHPQIPKLLAHFTEQRYEYLVQSYIEGDNLAHELARNGTFDESQIHQLLVALLPVLQFIHTHQVIHRDIKPANIIRQRLDQQLILVDFGASKLAGSASSMNRTGTIIGSAGYTAPEQAVGKAVFASDLYSLGVTCVHLLTNVPPFDLYSFTEGIWVWRDFLPMAISDRLGQVLDRMLQPAINQRYPSAAIALEALQSSSGGESRSKSLSTPSKSGRSLLSIPLPTGQLASALGPVSSPYPLSWRCIRTLEGHANSVSAIAMSPDGKILASGSFDRTIKLWHLGTGALITTLTGHQEPVTSLIFTPDGHTLISGSVDDTVRVWDWEREILYMTLTNSAAAALSLTLDISPDGQAIITGSDDHTVKIWQLSSGRLMRNLVHPRAVGAVKISPDGQFLVSGSHDNLIRVWDFSTGEMLYAMGEHLRDVNSLMIGPDSCLLVSGSSDNTLKIWDLQEGKLLRTLKGHLDWVRAVTISPDGSTIASGSDDHTIKLWDASTGRLLHTLGYRDGHQRGVNAVVFSPDGRTLVSGSGDRTVKLWRYQ
jgi:WD40 repeat protein